MKKILGLLTILSFVGSLAHPSDNRSAPNVFSSGSTISSSKMMRILIFWPVRLKKRMCTVIMERRFQMQSMMDIIH